MAGQELLSFPCRPRFEYPAAGRRFHDGLANREKYPRYGPRVVRRRDW